MGNHKKYRIKSLCDNKMAVRTALGLRTLVQTLPGRLARIVRRFRTAFVTSLRLSPQVSRASKISCVRTRLTRRMILSLSSVRKCFLPVGRLLRTFRRLVFLPDRLRKWTRCIIDWISARSALLPSSVALRFSPATTVADAVTISNEVCYGL